MRKLANESVFQRFLRKSLSYCYLNKSSFKKNHGNEYSERGVSDLDGHVNGYYTALELKMWGGRPSPVQLAYMRKIQRTGGIAFYVIYEYKGDHSFYWVNGGSDFSYRLKSHWIKTGLFTVPRDPKFPSGELVEVADCSPIQIAINLRNNDARPIP
tara:strand:+ start:3093 stop:3560 length:468 start_codon:yes stop_codon:yes gene_type:complete